MDNTLAFWLALSLLAIFVFLVKYLPGGRCTGDCEQGRKPCNCKEEK